MKLFNTLFLLILFVLSVYALKTEQQQYFIENNIGIEQPAPHKGGGSSIGYSFFKNVKDFETVFRKRILRPNASIGLHTQKEDEVYYIISGFGMMTLNDKTYNVKSGDAILTRTGASHGLKNTGNEDLELIIVYEK